MGKLILRVNDLTTQIRLLQINYNEFGEILSVLHEIIGLTVPQTSRKDLLDKVEYLQFREKIIVEKYGK